MIDAYTFERNAKILLTLNNKAYVNEISVLAEEM